MSAAYPLRRYRPPSSPAATSVPFFPFITVLIATMGVLIVLIVVIGQRVRQAAARHVAAQRESQKEELHAALQMLEWELEVLRQNLRVGEEKLRDTRLALAHLEDHTRRLKARRDFLAALVEKEPQPNAEGVSAAQLREQLAVVDAKIETVRQELETLRRKQGRRYYSIVPYTGPYGTNRWPIYLECRRDAIILQPEGISFTPEDFDEDMGPGNPLDVALRAVREYWVKHNLGGGEPYPLLLVRPSGIAAYYVARAALEPWGGQFGYELIGEEWEIVYPPANPQLAEQLATVVSEARARARALAMMAPRRMAAAPRRFVVSPDRGGLVPESGSPVLLPGSPRPTRPGVASGSGTEEPQPEGGGHAPDTSDNRSGMTEATSPQPPDRSAGTVYRGGAGAGDGFSRQLGLSSEVGFPAMGSPQNLGGTSPGDAGFGVTDQPEAGPTIIATPGAENRTEQSRLSGPRLNRRLADERGVNWAVPAAAQVLVPLRRPVRILCTGQGLIIQPERGLGAEKVIPWQDPPDQTVDELVRLVWEYVESWGPAGKGMAWRPTLRVEVAPGGEARFEQLKVLLDQSGLPLERAKP